MDNTEATAAALRKAFYEATETYPAQLAAFLTRDGEIAFRQWWNKFYQAIRDSSAGLSLLAELETLKEELKKSKE